MNKDNQIQPERKILGIRDEIIASSKKGSNEVFFYNSEGIVVTVPASYKGGFTVTKMSGKGAVTIKIEGHKVVRMKTTAQKKHRNELPTP